jgi:hypothetical protein
VLHDVAELRSRVCKPRLHLLAAPFELAPGLLQSLFEVSPSMLKRLSELPCRLIE